ncbi:MAG: glycosyltransferase family 39 protein [Chloroflexi bacterium]|nr:glycosyltransferase family 39 protein [Chloroflexota bacterium]
MNGLLNFQKRDWHAWAAGIVAFIGLAVYFIQAVAFAHTTVSNLDEGAYLLKGYLFASGEYHPFESGIWTNKAPLSFLIPGYVQLLFGPGLRTGRYLAVFFGMMAVVGTWVAARRIGNRWLAAGAVWVFALSPMVIKMYSGGATQSTIACLLAWSLALSLGEKRPLWQLMLGGFFAGLMMTVRENTMPVLPLLAVYVFWQHGWKAAAGLLVSGLAIVAVVHAVYWPEILGLWYWLPLIQLPVDAAYSGGGANNWKPEISLDSRMLSIFQAVRFHFAPLFGGAVSLLLMPRPSSWKSRTDFRAALFLFLLFGGLLYMHAMASVARNYCVFCFTPYIAFFNVAGILFLVVAMKSWNWRPSIAVQILLIFGVLVVTSGMGYSAFEEIGDSLLNLPAPRMRDFRILPGFVTWWDILSNKFHINYNSALRYASAAFGLFAGALILLLFYLVWRRVRRDSSIKFGAFLASAFLALVLAISPVLHGSPAARDCSSDVIAANEQIGEHLRKVIPQGSLVYWGGGLSAAPLLYLPGVRIIPAQINNGYAFRSNGDTAELFKFGLWNEEMNREWKINADVFIIEGWRYSNWKQFFDPQQFDELARSPLGTSCLEGTSLRIFLRK